MAPDWISATPPNIQLLPEASEQPLSRPQPAAGY
jgi:hypothetical protein